MRRFTTVKKTFEFFFFSGIGFGRSKVKNYFCLTKQLTKLDFRHF